MATPDYWYMIKDDGSYFEIKARDYSQVVEIDYDLIELSNGGYQSIDRGYLTDKYSTTLTFRDNKTYLSGFITALNELKDANKALVMGNIPEPIFGDNINYSGEIETLVINYGDYGSSTFNSFNFELTLLATDLIIIGNPVIPISLRCLQNDYLTTTEYNTHINESYYGNNWLVNREVDRYLFEGTYRLSDVDNIDFMAWHKQIRGTVVSIDESQFGVTDMFGPKFSGTTTFDVQIVSMSYNKVSPNLREIEIKLLKAVT